MDTSFSSTASQGEPPLLHSLREYWETVERRTEERPSFYLLIAFLIGFAVQVLPLRAFLGVVLRLVLVLLKPALLLLGLWKLSQAFRSSNAEVRMTK
jgi:hypothetical protein